MRNQVATLRVRMSIQVSEALVVGDAETEIPVMAMTTGAKTAAGDEVPEVTLMPDLAGLHDTLEAATSLVADWYADDAGVAA